MSGHSRWTPLNLENAYVDEQGLHYVAGYILALEDVLKDIDELDPPNYRYWELIRKVKDSVRQARRTLEVIKEKMDDAEAES